MDRIRHTHIYIYIYACTHKHAFIRTRGGFEDFFQGAAEVSSGGGENLPGGGEKIARYPLSLSVFANFYVHVTLLIYAHFF